MFAQGHRHAGTLPSLPIVFFESAVEAARVEDAALEEHYGRLPEAERRRIQSGHVT